MNIIITKLPKRKLPNAGVLIFIFFMGLSLLACKNKTSMPEDKVSQFVSESSLALSDTDRFTAASFEMCDCMQPMLEIVQSIDKTQQKDDSKSLQMLEAKLDKIRPNITACGEAIRQKYGDMKSPNEKSRILKALKNHCPESFEILNKGILVHSETQEQPHKTQF